MIKTSVPVRVLNVSQNKRIAPHHWLGILFAALSEMQHFEHAASYQMPSLGTGGFGKVDEKQEVPPRTIVRLGSVHSLQWVHYRQAARSEAPMTERQSRSRLISDRSATA
jgi:hypothetical protein